MSDDTSSIKNESIVDKSKCTSSDIHTEVIYTSAISEELIPKERYCEQLTDESVFPAINTEIQEDILEDPLCVPPDTSSIKIEVALNELLSASKVNSTVIKEELILEELQCEKQADECFSSEACTVVTEDVVEAKSVYTKNAVGSKQSKPDVSEALSLPQLLAQTETGWKVRVSFEDILWSKDVLLNV